MPDMLLEIVQRNKEIKRAVKQIITIFPITSRYPPIQSQNPLSLNQRVSVDKIVQIISRNIKIMSMFYLKREIEIHVALYWLRRPRSY